MMNITNNLQPWIVMLRVLMLKIVTLKRYCIPTKLLTLLFFMSASIEAWPATTDNTKIIVSYSYNFAKNIEWPQEQNLAAFTIALYGVEDKSLINEFLKLNNRVSLKGAPVKVIQTSNLRALSSANLVYIGKNEDIAQIQNFIGNKPILLITNEAKNKRLVMINLFKNGNQAIKFEVNKANLINNNLTALPELILLGGTEIDVAKLYREGQASLINLQNQLASQQSRLSELQKQSNIQKNNNNQLIKQMKSLNEDINEIKNSNLALLQDQKKLKKTIQESQITIEKQKQDIANSELQKQKLIQQVRQRNIELKEKNIELEKKQLELNNISLSISNKESRLATLNVTIEQQQAALLSQKIRLSDQASSIEALDKLVSAQRWSLYFMIGLVLTTTALLCLGIFAYKMKKEDNERLAKRSHDLQVARDKLEIAKRKAEEANRTKGAFLSMMSHELRTPLQSIIGYTDLVIEDLKAEGDEFYSDQLVRVHANGERLLALINNTLDLAKIEAGKMDVQLTPTHIGSLIEEAIGNIKPLLAKNNNKLEVDIDNDEHIPVIDHDKLLHMVVNLLSNATKFTQEGLISITVKNQTHLLTLIVSDTGIGLTDSQKEEIFTRFHQADSGEKRSFQGTGLGLSITQYFCEIMGGSIRAEDRLSTEKQIDSSENKPNTGSSFIIEIPLPVVIVNKKLTDDDEHETFAVA